MISEHTCQIHVIVGSRGRIGSSIKEVLSKERPCCINIPISSAEFTVNRFHQLFQEPGIDRQLSTTVYWCTGSASVSSHMSECVEDLAVVRRSTSVIDLLQPDQMVLVSSGGSVYGSCAGEVNELSPIQPDSLYAELKVKIEEIFTELATRLGNQLLVLRLANVYGGGGSSKRKGLVDSLLLKKNIDLRAHLNSTKQYGHAEDYAKGILQVGDLVKNSHQSLVTRNLFPDLQYSIGDIVRLVDSNLYSAISRSSVDHSNLLPLETVILRNVPGFNRIDIAWRTLQRFLSERIDGDNGI